LIGIIVCEVLYHHHPVKILLYVSTVSAIAGNFGAGFYVRATILATSALRGRSLYRKCFSVLFEGSLSVIRVGLILAVLFAGMKTTWSVGILIPVLEGILCHRRLEFAKKCWQDAEENAVDQFRINLGLEG